MQADYSGKGRYGVRVNPARAYPSPKKPVNKATERQPRRRHRGGRYRLAELENRDRWMVSYADFITLLLALFVVMYAISHINEGKHRILTGSLVSAFGAKSDHQNILSLTPDEPALQEQVAAKKARRAAEAQRQRRERMEVVAHDIMAAFAPLGPLIENGQVRVIHSDRGLSVEINASVLFATGQAVLQEDSSKVLEAVAQVLKDGDQMIRVEGHTDDIPIVTEKFPSNWELSAVRASSVVRLLIDNGVAGARLIAAGYGEYRPVNSNDTEEGRMRNRRVTITILSSSPDSEPGASPGTSDKFHMPPDALPEVLKGHAA
ncbi:chemotaxis protein MotB [Nitrosospira sp. Nsp2]|uniref:flagellar motor protein MotD n=1 Tax=Nitrosospira sp. Nsp2 TaxID=136548 RepID=UPI000D3097A1|nr:flagellar motor protein MotD [Nitrosospira sp. Nsp2]PTR16439.1 chemotaxis protein MotB [Nitrosospira sp. Nsp2]